MCVFRGQKPGRDRLRGEKDGGHVPPASPQLDHAARWTPNPPLEALPCPGGGTIEAPVKIWTSTRSCDGDLFDGEILELTRAAALD